MLASFLTDGISGFLEDLAKDLVKQINEWLVDLLDIVLNADKYMGSHFHLEGISFTKVNSTILKFALALIVLKFLQKGFMIYILQSDGDPDHDPLILLTGFFQAIAIAVSFMGLYTPVMGVFKSFTKQIINAITSKGEIQQIKQGIIDTLLGRGLTSVIFVVVFLVMVLVLYIFFIKQGFELMVLKYSLSITCVGLMDSDGGTFKISIKKFLQMGFTCTIQIILLRFSIALCLTLHPIWAIACIATALGTPKLMQEFLIARNGGGISSKLYTLSMFRNLAR